ncbi:MAG: hypothetical protein LBE13_00485 [Bacteroidales bacterium]|jgi:hypothetical protein|nr:hypothetical protein [Bacteroidales bacterium]
MAKKKNKIKKIVLGILCITFIFSLFVSNRRTGEDNYHLQRSYPEGVKTAMDSLLKFFNSVDSTLNVLTSKDSAEYQNK